MDGSTDPISSFMKSPLVQWLQLVSKSDALEFDDLVDGCILNQIMLNLHPQAKIKPVHDNPRDDVLLRKENLQIVLEQIKTFYENVVQHVVVMPLPNLIKILYESPSYEAAAEMEKLLELVLGCAVQSEPREFYVEVMKQLTYNGMNAMMAHIKNVTENSANVISVKAEDYGEDGSASEQLAHTMLHHIVALTNERDHLAQSNLDMSMQRLVDEDDDNDTRSSVSRHDSFASKHSIIGELNDVRAQLRRAKLRYDESMDNNAELKEQLDEVTAVLNETHKKNEQLQVEARSARAYRDENDILKEKTNKLHKMEVELDAWKDKLKDLEYYKKRVEALREDYKTLHESKALVQDELDRVTLQLEGMAEKDRKICELRTELNNCYKEEEKDKSKIEELSEHISRLQLDNRQSVNENGNLSLQLARVIKNQGERPSIQQESEESMQSRLLQLESENKRLAAMNSAYQETLRANEATQASVMELEKENQRLSNKLKKEKDNTMKEKQAVVDFEKLSKDLQADQLRLESALQVSRSTSDREIQELRDDNEQLMKEIEMLRERNKSEGTDKQKELEKDNKIYTELCKDLTAKFRKSENERKELQKTYTQSMHKVNSADKIQKENAKLEKENLALEKQVKQLEEQCSHVETLEQTASDLTIENKQLKKQTGQLKALTQQLQELEDDKQSSEQQIGKMKRQNESFKRQLESMSELQAHNEDLDKKCAYLQQSADTLRNKLKQAEKLEVTQMELETELERVRTDLNRSKNQLAKRENEFYDLESQNDQLSSQLNQLRIKEKKMEIREEASRESEAQTAQLSGVNKQLRKELQLARHHLQVKEGELEEAGVELRKLKEINKELMEVDYHHDKTNPSSPAKLANENLVKSSGGGGVEENGGSSSSVSPSSSSNHFDDVKLIKDYKKVKRDYFDLLDRHQDLLNDKQRTAGEGAREIVKIQDRLISTERENAALQTEIASMKVSSKEQDNRMEEFQSQAKLDHKQLIIEREKLQVVQNQYNNMQAENSALQSQCGSLMKQLASNSDHVSTADNRCKQLKHDVEKAEEARRGVERDLDNVQACYERQTVELEGVVDENRKLKDMLRDTQAQMKELRKRSKEVNSEENRSMAKRDMQDLEAVKNAHEKLKSSYSKLSGEYGELQDENSHVKSLNNQLKLQLAKLSAEGSDIKGHNQQLDITAAKLKNRCDVLNQLKDNLEEENRHLVDQVSRLMSQNEDLLLQMLDSKDQIYSEQKQYTERMQEVRRQKEKLEEKIMDIYRTPGYTSPKRKSFGATIKKTFQNLGGRSSDYKKQHHHRHNHRDLNNSSPYAPTPSSSSANTSIVAPPNKTHDVSAASDNNLSSARSPHPHHHHHNETTSTDSGSQGWGGGGGGNLDELDASGRSTPSRGSSHHYNAPTPTGTDQRGAVNSSQQQQQQQPTTYLRSRAMALSKNNKNASNNSTATPAAYPPPSDHRLSTLLGIAAPMPVHTPLNLSPHPHHHHHHTMPVPPQISPIHPVRVDVPPDHNPPGYTSHMLRHDVPPPPPPPHVVSPSPQNPAASAAPPQPQPPNAASSRNAEDKDDLWYEYGCL